MSRPLYMYNHDTLGRDVSVNHVFFGDRVNRVGRLPSVMAATEANDGVLGDFEMDVSTNTLYYSDKPINGAMFTEANGGTVHGFTIDNTTRSLKYNGEPLYNDPSVDEYLDIGISEYCKTVQAGLNYMDLNGFPLSAVYIRPEIIKGGFFIDSRTLTFSGERHSSTLMASGQIYISRSNVKFSDIHFVYNPVLSYGRNVNLLTRYVPGQTVTVAAGGYQILWLNDYPISTLLLHHAGGTIQVRESADMATFATVAPTTLASLGGIVVDRYVFHTTLTAECTTRFVVIRETGGSTAITINKIVPNYVEEEIDDVYNKYGTYPRYLLTDFSFGQLSFVAGTTPGGAQMSISKIYFSFANQYNGNSAPIKLMASSPAATLADYTAGFSYDGFVNFVDDQNRPTSVTSVTIDIPPVSIMNVFAEGTGSYSGSIVLDSITYSNYNRHPIRVESGITFLSSDTIIITSLTPFTRIYMREDPTTVFSAGTTVTLQSITADGTKVSSYSFTQNGSITLGMKTRQVRLVNVPTATVSAIVLRQSGSDVTGNIDWINHYTDEDGIVRNVYNSPQIYAGELHIYGAVWFDGIRFAFTAFSIDNVAISLPVTALASGPPRTLEFTFASTHIIQFQLNVTPVLTALMINIDTPVVTMGTGPTPITYPLSAPLALSESPLIIKNGIAFDNVHFVLNSESTTYSKYGEIRDSGQTILSDTTMVGGYSFKQSGAITLSVAKDFVILHIPDCTAAISLTGAVIEKLWSNVADYDNGDSRALSAGTLYITGNVAFSVINITLASAAVENNIVQVQRITSDQTHDLKKSGSVQFNNSYCWARFDIPIEATINSMCIGCGTLAVYQFDNTANAYRTISSSNNVLAPLGATSSAQLEAGALLLDGNGAKFDAFVALFGANYDWAGLAMMTITDGTAGLTAAGDITLSHATKRAQIYIPAATIQMTLKSGSTTISTTGTGFINDGDTTTPMSFSANYALAAGWLEIYAAADFDRISVVITVAAAPGATLRANVSATTIVSDGTAVGGATCKQNGTIELSSAVDRLTLNMPACTISKFSFGGTASEANTHIYGPNSMSTDKYPIYANLAAAGGIEFGAGKYLFRNDHAFTKIYLEFSGFNAGSAALSIADIEFTADFASSKKVGSLFFNNMIDRALLYTPAVTSPSLVHLSSTKPMARIMNNGTDIKSTISKEQEFKLESPYPFNQLIIKFVKNIDSAAWPIGVPNIYYFTNSAGALVSPAIQTADRHTSSAGVDTIDELYRNTSTFVTFGQYYNELTFHCGPFVRVCEITIHEFSFIKAMAKNLLKFDNCRFTVDRNYEVKTPMMMIHTFRASNNSSLSFLRTTYDHNDELYIYPRACLFNVVESTKFKFERMNLNLTIASNNSSIIQFLKYNDSRTFTGKDFIFAQSDFNFTFDNLQRFFGFGIISTTIADMFVKQCNVLIACRNVGHSTCYTLNPNSAVNVNATQNTMIMCDYAQYKWCTENNKTISEWLAMMYHQDTFYTAYVGALARFTAGLEFIDYANFDPRSPGLMSARYVASLERGHFAVAGNLDVNGSARIVGALEVGNVAAPTELAIYGTINSTHDVRRAEANTVDAFMNCKFVQGDNAATNLSVNGIQFEKDFGTCTTTPVAMRVGIGIDPIRQGLAAFEVVAMWEQTGTDTYVAKTAGSDLFTNGTYKNVILQLSLSETKCAVLISSGGANDLSARTLTFSILTAANTWVDPATLTLTNPEDINADNEYYIYKTHVTAGNAPGIMVTWHRAIPSVTQTGLGTGYFIKLTSDAALASGGWTLSEAKCSAVPSLAFTGSTPTQTNIGPISFSLTVQDTGWFYFRNYHTTENTNNTFDAIEYKSGSISGAYEFRNAAGTTITPISGDFTATSRDGIIAFGSTFTSIQLRKPVGGPSTLTMRGFILRNLSKSASSYWDKDGFISCRFLSSTGGIKIPVLTAIPTQATYPGQLGQLVLVISAGIKLYAHNGTDWAAV